MSKRYLDGETEQAIREALRFQDFDIVAAKTQFDPDELRRLLNLPSLKPVPTDQDQEFDLFAAEELDGVL